MAYELRFANGVESDITDFALGFPERHQDAALDRIERKLYRLAANPLAASRLRGDSGPRHTFRIYVAGAWYPLAVSFHYSQDEKAIVITRFRRQRF